MRDENLSYRSNEIFERNFTISVSLPFDLSVCIVIENTEKGIKYFIYIYIKKILSLATRKPKKIDRSINFTQANDSRFSSPNPSKTPSPKGESKGNWNATERSRPFDNGHHPTRLFTRRNPRGGFLRSSIPRPRRIDTIQLPAREKKGIQGRERERSRCPTDVFSPPPSFVERTRNARGRGGCWPPKACFNSLIRRERQGAENNRAFSRGTFQSSSSARRVVPFSIGEGGRGMVGSKDPEEVVSFRRFSFSHRCRRRHPRSPSLSLSFFSLFFPRDPRIRAPLPLSSLITPCCSFC